MSPLPPQAEDKGIVIVHNKNQFCVFKLHYSADPDKPKEWSDGLRATYPSPDIWNQEMELDFTKSVGLRIYPDFKEHTHVKENLQAIPYKDVFRFWDFGYRHPVCIFAQVNDDDQLVILDELFGTDVVILEFARSIKRKTKKDYPGFKVKDYCDPAGKFKSDKSQRTTIDIMHTLDIWPRYKASSVSDGINLLRTIMLEREDGTPGLLVDRKCHVVVDAFLGGYVRNEVTEEPVKEGFYEHPMDALRYGAVNIFSTKSFDVIKPGFPWTRRRKTASAVSGY